MRLTPTSPPQAPEFCYFFARARPLQKRVRAEYPNMNPASRLTPVRRGFLLDRSELHPRVHVLWKFRNRLGFPPEANEWCTALKARLNSPEPGFPFEASVVVFQVSPFPRFPI